MDELKQKMLDMIGPRYPLEPLPVAEDLQEIRLPLGYLKMNLYNWRTNKVRKVNIMRSAIKVPKLEIFAIEFDPEDGYDIPLLAIDFSCMKKKTFVYMNFIPLFADSAYREKYLDRLQPVKARYRIEPPGKPKEWMQPYLTAYSIYSMADNSLLDDAKKCALDYLSCYLDLLDEAEMPAASDYRRKAAEASLNYCNQLSEKDGSRKMLGRFIGKDRANRIFNEVIR
jgi:hypothetical protein